MLVLSGPASRTGGTIESIDPSGRGWSAWGPATVQANRGVVETPVAFYFQSMRFSCRSYYSSRASAVDPSS